MSNDLRVIVRGALQFLLGALVSFGAFKLYVWSAMHPLSPEAWVEVVQESILLFASLAFMVAAVRVREASGGLWLIAGFLMSLFIRELDCWFDYIRHGAWKYVFMLWLAILAWIIATRARDTVISGLAHFIKSRAWYLMLAGVTIVLVYSRLYGMKGLWELYAMGSCSTWPSIKSFSEESMELVGYTLIFFSGVLYMLDVAAMKRDQLNDKTI
ncbi:MAG: hypothetical protein KHX35_08385 [Sutterella wadsworthensis]|nr:hypothetical protein [Sutterella wadsworthensis]